MGWKNNLLPSFADLTNSQWPERYCL